MHQNQLRANLIFLITPTTTRQFAAYPYTTETQKVTKSRKNLEQKFIFQLDTISPHGINERSSCH